MLICSSPGCQTTAGCVCSKTIRHFPTHDLREAVRDYISECDNPVPDYNHRRTLRNRLRELSGAPPEPPSRFWMINVRDQ